jgi:hypothetical protein
MSKDTELALRKLKREQKDNIKRLDGIIGETSRRYHNEDDVKVSLKTLIGAIEVLKDEQKILVDTQIKLSKQMAEQVDEAIKKINAERIEMVLNNHVNKVEQKSYELSRACDKKIDEIKSINMFLNGKFLRVLISLSIFIGGVGGAIYFIRLVNEISKEAFKLY